MKLGLEATLVAGKSGIFEVNVDGKIVAKRSLLSFPNEDEIVAAVAKAVGKK